jgi:hypothetical protein
LAAVRVASVVRYREALTKDPTFKPTVVTSEQAARDLLADSAKHFDAFVIDNNLGNAFELIKELRQAYPRLAIVLVDEEADFGMPGRADEVSTTPFTNDDLVKKIKRLMQERRLETLRADALPPVRMFAKRISKEGKGSSKYQAAVETVKELGYDYVAFYAIAPTEPPTLSLSAQTGSNTVQSLVPIKSDYTGLLGWVVQNGQSKIVGPEDQPSHILIEKGKFGEAACVPVGTTLRFGVFLACREQPGTISREGVLMLELIASQLAAALAKDARN